MEGNFIHNCPVHSSSDLDRDIVWYRDKLGFELRYKEKGYAVLHRDGQWIHLQWHASTTEDPVYGSMTKLFVKDIYPILEDLVQRGAVSRDKLRLNTPWKTHEFGLYDLNKNAIFFVQDI